MPVIQTEWQERKEEKNSCLNVQRGSSGFYGALNKNLKKDDLFAQYEQIAGIKPSAITQTVEKEQQRKRSRY